ncbi:MAG: hypothetical protein NZ932_05065 [Candidatus Bathyarchaeota archaeon]|nr:hypothetical protein [Candidatus Bathyarchaeota archaeon]
MPWEVSANYIRSGHRSVDEFEPESFRTVVISEGEGIKAVVGKPKGKRGMEVVSFLFDVSKGWTLEKAKEWFERHQQRLRSGAEHFVAVLPFKVVERVAEKPLRIRGIALTAGMSRNLNIYLPEELEAFASRLVSAPVYIEHVAASNAVGKVVNAHWDGQNLWYEAEIYDDEVAEKIRRGLIRHVSIGADYERLDVVDGKIPRGLHNAELSLVAVPGIPETNIQIVEKLMEQGGEPIASGEYILGFYQDLEAFLPEHFSTVWIDRENGVFAIMGKPKAEPDTSRVQSIFFAKDKLWNQQKIRDWLAMHPTYMTPVKPSGPSNIGVNQSGSLFVKDAKPTVPVEVAVKMLRDVLPSPMVERSWGFGPQRMCQELRKVIYRLERFSSSGVGQDELAETIIK